MISDSDGNIDNQIDNQIDNSIEIKTPISISIPSVPPIDILSTNFIEVTNFPLLNGLYRREYAININYYYLRIDSLYYFWKPSDNNFWLISNSETFTNEFKSEDSEDSFILPTTNWYEIANPENKIPITITAI